MPSAATGLSSGADRVRRRNLDVEDSSECDGKDSISKVSSRELGCACHVISPFHSTRRRRCRAERDRRRRRPFEVLVAAAGDETVEVIVFGRDPSRLCKGPTTLWATQRANRAAVSIRPRDAHLLARTAFNHQKIVVVGREEMAALADGVEEPAVVCRRKVDNLPITRHGRLIVG